MSETGILWVLVCTALLVIMQAGFLCLESGAVRRKNTINVAMKSLLDQCMVGGLCGYAFMHGSPGGFVGSGGFAGASLTSPESQLHFLFQMMFCGAAITIVSGAIAERTRMGGYLAIAAVTSVLMWAIGHGLREVGWQRRASSILQVPR